MHSVKITTMSHFIKNLTGPKNLTSKTVYCIIIGRRKKFIVNIIDYTSMYFIDICSSLTKEIVISRIANEVSEQLTALYS